MDREQDNKIEKRLENKSEAIKKPMSNMAQAKTIHRGLKFWRR